MKLPRRTIPASGRGRCRAAGASRIAWAQTYPSRPVRMVVGCPAGSARRYRRAPDRPMAVGAARPAIHHREPAGCWRQHRHRGGRARRPLTAIRCSCSPTRRTRSTRRSTTSSISISFATLRRSRASSARPCPRRGNPSFPAKTVPEFIAYAKANPGKINMASAGNGSLVPCRRRAVQDDDRRRHDPRAVSRWSARAHRPARRAGAGHVRHHVRLDRAHQSREAPRTGGDHRDALGSAADVPTVADFVPGFEASGWYGIGAPKNTPAEIVDSSTRRSMRASPIPSSKRSWPTSAAPCFWDHARRIRQAHRLTKPRSGAKYPGDRHQGGVSRVTAPIFHKSRPRKRACELGLSLRACVRPRA